MGKFLTFKWQFSGGSSAKKGPFWEKDAAQWLELHRQRGRLLNKKLYLLVQLLDPLGSGWRYDCRPVVFRKNLYFPPNWQCFPPSTDLQVTLCLSTTQQLLSFQLMQFVFLNKLLQSKESELHTFIPCTFGDALENVFHFDFHQYYNWW